MANRALPFVLAATDVGTMIVNYLDEHKSANGSYGVGYTLLNSANFEQNELKNCLELLKLRAQYFSSGVLMIDCGANIGVYTVGIAKEIHAMGGGVLAFEAQERIFYALAGNIALNNCFNARAINAALGNPLRKDEYLEFSSPDYTKNASFGSLELKQNEKSEFIGQELNSKIKTRVPLTKLDFFEFSRVDLIKIDVEGMEIELLKGALNTIKKHKPIMQIEIIKSNHEELCAFLTELGYEIFALGMNVLAIYKDDPCLKHIKS